jgi:hypothetical protein
LTHDDPQQRALASAVRANDGYLLTRSEAERDVTQQWSAVRQRV